MAENIVTEHLNITIEDTDIKKQDTGIIVLVPDKQIDYSFWEAASEIGFDIYIFETEKEVDRIIETRTIESLYIRSKNKSEYLSLVSRFKKLNRNATVVYFTNLKEILFTNFNTGNQLNIIKENFKLINTILAEEDVQVVNHIDDVVRYVELLCERLQVSDNQKLITVAAAYVHDFSLLIMDNTLEHKNENEIVRLSSQCLKKINYNSDICSLLDLMYTDINTTTVNTDNFILANILTAADYLCHSKYSQSMLTLEEFKQLNEIISAKTGSVFLSEVSQELMNIFYNTISISKAIEHNCYVLIYSELGEDQLMLKGCLDNLGFEAEFVSSVDNLIECNSKRKADILIIESKGTVLQVSDLVNKIEDHDISFENVTTYLLTNSESVFELTGLLQKGIEDIFSAENDLDPFLIKIIRTKKRISEQSQNQLSMLEKMGTFGSLSDISLIDLLQTMNGSGKTCMISITANCRQLSIYLHDGIIAYAESDDIKGKEAIFIGFEWDIGVWNVDPIDLKDFPAPNIDQPINNILLEGCQALDESRKIKTDSEINLDETFNLLDI